MLLSCEDTMTGLRAERERLQLRLIFGNDATVKPCIRELTEQILTLQRTHGVR